MYATFDLNDASPHFDSTVSPQDDFEGLLNDNVEVTELPLSPASQANRSKKKPLQKSSHASDADPAPDKAGQARKQRALEKSREAQKRFRHRQKVLVSTSVPALLVCKPGWRHGSQRICLTAGETRRSPSAVGCDHNSVEGTSCAATATADPECPA